MSPLARPLVVVLVVGSVASCSSSDGSTGDADPTIDTAPPVELADESQYPTCVTEGVEYTTTLESCAEALRIGRELSFELGFVVSPTGQAADVNIAVTCLAVKDGSGMTYSDPATLTMAERTVESGVCTGDPANLTPSE